MASTPSPTSALMASQLMQRLAGGGAPGGGAAGAAQPDQSGQQVQSQFAALQSADPEMATKTIQKIQQLLGPLYMAMIQQVPDAASHIASAQKALNAALKSVQQAQATLNTVRPQIANSANLPPGFPGAGGGAGPDASGGIEGM